MAQKTKRNKRQKEESGAKKGSRTIAARWARFKLTLTHNRTNLRSLALLFSVLCMGVFTVTGFTHAHHVQQVRAMTVSSSNKQFKFSKTGNTARLEQQYHNGDLYVAPVKFDTTTSMATSASQYKVFFKESIQKKQYALGDIKSSFVVFGSTGYAAVVLYGDLPRAPLQVLIRDDMPINTVDFSDGGGQVVSDNGNHHIEFDGRSQKVNYDAATFSVNPKGSNVKTDTDINRNMDLSTLFNVIAGKERVAKNEEKIKKLNYAQSQNLAAQKQYFNQLAQINKTLGRPADDMADDSTSTSADANTTLETNRSSILENIDTCKQNTVSYSSSVQSAKTNLKQTGILVKSMNSYGTMSSRYSVLS